MWYRSLEDEIIEPSYVQGWVASKGNLTPHYFAVSMHCKCKYKRYIAGRAIEKKRLYLATKSEEEPHSCSKWPNAKRYKLRV